MNKWIAEFDLEEGDRMPEHMDLEYMGAKIDFHCRPMWIPVTTRPMTEEERDRYKEQLEYVDDAVIFNCPLPDDGQEVLITVYGETELDTFYNDSIDGCYFENRDIDDVEAWMPKPTPYKPQKSEDEE